MEIQLIFIRISNSGRLVWKIDGGEHMSYTQKIVPLKEYLSKAEKRQLQFYDKSEINRIASRTGVNRESVRTALRRRGYKLTMNAHGLLVWAKNAEQNHKDKACACLKG